MFDLKDVGRKIAARRKEKNMTQMELADSIGVSFQAVSNWERGNSMPDIAKLPELSALLDFSIDALLNDEQPLELVKHILDGDEQAYIQQEAVKPKTIAEVAPILKPQQTESMFTAALSGKENELNAKDLAAVAPFVSDDYLSGWAMKIASIEHINDLVSLAPFLAEETLDALVDKLAEETLSLKSLVPLAPFLSEEALDKLARRAAGDANVHDLTALAPFLSETTLDAIADQLAASPDLAISALVPLAPFLSEEALGKLARGSLDTVNPDDVVKLAPFLPDDVLRECADVLAAKHGIKAILPLAPFL